MPLKSGKGKSVHASNVQEMLHSFKKSGKIGSTRPASMSKAASIANAAAYRKERGGKRKKG